MFSQTSIILALLILLLICIVGCNPVLAYGGIALVTYAIFAAIPAVSPSCWYGGAVSREVTLQSEYQNWLISRVIIRTACQANHSKCRILLEGWIQGTIPMYDADFTPRGGVLRYALNSRSYITKIFKAIDIGIGEQLAEQIDVFAQALRTNTWPNPEFNDIKHPILDTDTTLQYGDYIVNKTDRMKLLLSLGSPEQVLAMTLRYSTILAAAHHWAVPTVVFETLWKLGVRNEAFASPINALTLGKKDGSYYTQFIDTDKPFGSNGSWITPPIEDLAKKKGVWMINPPFTKCLMKAAASRAVELVDAGGEIIFITRVNEQEDAPYKQLLDIEDAAALTLHVPYEAQGPSGSTIKWPAFSTHIIYIGDPTKSENILNTIAEVWQSIPTQVQANT